MWHVIRYPIYNLRRLYFNIHYGLRNLIRWLPVIWKDRDWDEEYLMIIMQKKLEQMENLHRNHGHAENSEDVANEIKDCIVALSRAMENDYVAEVREHYIDDIERMIKEDLIDGGKGGIVESDINRATMYKFLIKENELRNNDLEKVFSKDISKKINRWWD